VGFVEVDGTVLVPVRVGGGHGWHGTSRPSFGTAACRIGKDAAVPESRVEDVVRRRLRSLRAARGWTLDELARRSNIGASTISRIETGHRRLAVDQLADLARALETTVDGLLAEDDDEDVVIRPTRTQSGNAIEWRLSRAYDPSGRVVAKLRIPASKRAPEPQVHPGRDWFYVLEGTARLVLGDRELLVEPGQAAEFDTMTPHWIAGFGGPVEILTIFDRDGEHAHLRASRPAP
jgi:transcriptional regulator with XRE-family HTH domain